MWSRTRATMCPARSASPTTQSSAALTSSRFGGCLSRKFLAAQALMRTAAIGWLTS